MRTISDKEAKELFESDDPKDDHYECYWENPQIFHWDWKTSKRADEDSSPYPEGMKDFFEKLDYSLRDSSKEVVVVELDGPVVWFIGDRK